MISLILSLFRRPKIIQVLGLKKDASLRVLERGYHGS